MAVLGAAAYRQTLGDSINGAFIHHLGQIAADTFKLVFQIAGQLAVGQRQQSNQLAALHHFAHIRVILTELLSQLGLADQHNPQQPLKTAFEFEKSLQVFQGRQGHTVRLFNQQHMLVAGFG